MFDQGLPSDPNQCNGSDVFGSDICTCRPYLIYGIEEAVKEAQKFVRHHSHSMYGTIANALVEVEVG
jgi:GTP cyclohydrolase II